jgi:YVTN family beta-propeller protein
VDTQVMTKARRSKRSKTRGVVLGAAGSVLLWGCSNGTGPTVRTHPAGTSIQLAVVRDRPYGIAVSESGLVLVSRLDAAQLSRLSLSNQTEQGTIGVGLIPTDVVLSPEGDVAYVANQFSQNVGVVNVQSGQQVAQVSVTGDPFRVLVSADGGTVYATSNADKVFVINAATRSVVRSIAVGLDPNGMALSPSEDFLYVSGQTDGTLAKVNPATGQVVTTVNVCPAPQEVVMSPSGDEVYVACLGGGLEVRRASDLGGITTIAGASGGFGMAMSPDGVQLYVTQTLLGTIAVIDRTSRSLVTSIAVGGNPRRVRFSESGETAVVADETGAVAFIR